MPTFRVRIDYLLEAANRSELERRISAESRQELTNNAKISDEGIQIVGMVNASTSAKHKAHPWTPMKVVGLTVGFLLLLFLGYHIANSSSAVSGSLPGAGQLALYTSTHYHYTLCYNSSIFTPSHNDLQTSGQPGEQTLTSLDGRASATVDIYPLGYGLDQIFEKEMKTLSENDPSTHFRTQAIFPSTFLINGSTTNESFMEKAIQEGSMVKILVIRYRHSDSADYDRVAGEMTDCFLNAAPQATQ